MLTINEIVLNVYTYFMKEKQRNKPLFSLHNVIDRTVQATQISRATLFRLIKKDASKSEETQNSSSSKRGAKVKLDSFDKDVIRQAAINMMTEKKHLSLKSLKKELAEKKDLHVKKITLLKTLHQLGFRYGKVSKCSRLCLFERKDLVQRRANFLRDIADATASDSEIVYLDETWVDQNTYTSHQWMASEEDEVHIKKNIPLSKGKRFILLHAGSERGWVDGCKLVYRAQSSDGKYKFTILYKALHLTVTRRRLSLQAVYVCVYVYIYMCVCVCVHVCLCQYV